MTTFDDAVLYAWDSRAGQYAPTGPAGITLERHAHNATVTDCLLYRSPEGELQGILNHYNAGNIWERPGSVNIYVKPGHQRLGIASALLRDAWHRWPLKLENQRLNDQSQAWLDSLVAMGKVDTAKTHSLNEQAWKAEPPGLVEWWKDQEST